MTRRNRYGIAEPVAARRALYAARQLDVIVVPVVAFDDDCHRIGFGGGFYDRALAHRRRDRRLRRPLIIGVAFDVQRQQSIRTSRWDVPVDCLVTESRFLLRRSVCSMRCIRDAWPL